MKTWKKGIIKKLLVCFLIRFSIFVVRCMIVLYMSIFFKISKEEGPALPGPAAGMFPVWLPQS